MNNSDEKEKISLKARLYPYLVFGSIIILAILTLFGGPIIKYIKARQYQNDLDRIHYGGTRSEANKSIDKYNERIKKLQTMKDSVINTRKEILIFTNDTSSLKGIVEANINYNVFEESSLGNPLITRNNGIIEEIDNFIIDEDNLGYNIFLKNKNTDFQIKNLTNIDEETKYKVMYTFYYDKKTKEYLRDKINNKKKSQFPFLSKSKKEQLADLEEEHFLKTVITESELKKGKIKDNLKALFVPRGITLKPNHKFYFAVYNKKMNEKEFEEKIELFVKMFKKEKNKKGCFIKRIELKSSI